MSGYRTLTAYVETYGCQMNIADGELMEGLLVADGFELVESPEQADMIVVNTCAIRENAEKRVLGRVSQLNYFKRVRPRVVICVTGCVAQRMKESLLAQAPYVDLVVGPDGYRDLTMTLRRIHAGLGAEGTPRQLSVVDLRLDEDYSGIEQYRRSDVTAWVPIQRGCNHRCTFCIVPYVRGPEKNRNPFGILEEIGDLVTEGITEVTLLGQTVNSYRYWYWDFAELLTAVAQIPGLERVRFTSPHPNDVTPALIETMATEFAVCEHIHLPLQSGSDRVLRRMLRRYTADKFLATVDMIRAKIPQVALSTDVIVGFPGETDRDFEQTIELLEKVRFDEAFTYRYSPREGTPATRLPSSEFVDDHVSQERLEKLIDVTRRIQAEINHAEVGRYREILIERKGRYEGTVMGRTRRNKVVAVEGTEADIGQYLMVKLHSTTGATFEGRRLPLQEEPAPLVLPPMPPPGHQSCSEH